MTFGFFLCIFPILMIVVPIIILLIDREQENPCFTDEDEEMLMMFTAHQEMGGYYETEGEYDAFYN